MPTLQDWIIYLLEIPKKIFHKKTQRNSSLTLRFSMDIAVPIQMWYNITSQSVGARQCRAPTGVPY